MGSHLCHGTYPLPYYCAVLDNTINKIIRKVVKDAEIYKDSLCDNDTLLHIDEYT